MCKICVKICVNIFAHFLHIILHIFVHIFYTFLCTYVGTYRYLCRYLCWYLCRYLCLNRYTKMCKKCAKWCVKNVQNYVQKMCTKMCKFLCKFFFFLCKICAHFLHISNLHSVYTPREDTVIDSFSSIFVQIEIDFLRLSQYLTLLWSNSSFCLIVISMSGKQLKFLCDGKFYLYYSLPTYFLSTYYVWGLRCIQFQLFEWWHTILQNTFGLCSSLLFGLF